MLGLGLSLTTIAIQGRRTSLAALFANGEQGVWYDPSDLSSMYQDHLGTIPAAYGQPVGLILDKSGNGNHASQATATARPTLGRVPKGGRRNLLTWSEDFSNAAWAKQLTTVASEGDRFKLRTNGTSGGHQIYPVSGVPTTAGLDYQCFIDAAPSEYTEIYVSFTIAGHRLGAFFNLVTDDVTNDSGVFGKIETLIGGVKRCHIKVTAATTAVRFLAVFLAKNGSVTTNEPEFSGLYIYRAQVELSPIATPYQRVTTALDVFEDRVQSLSYLYRDPVDDTLPWVAPAGSYDIVHIPLTGPATVLTAQALSGATNILLAENTRAYLAIDRRLTATEIDALTAYYGASA